MIRRALLLTLFFVLASAAMSTFFISESVIEKQSELAALKKQVNAEEDRLAVLQAEWVYLTAPRRLEALAAQHLPHLRPSSGAQITTISAVPLQDVTLAAMQRSRE